MSDFRYLTQTFAVSPQLTVNDIEDASRRGFALIVNNRPEGESDDQLAGAAAEAAATACGLDYLAIPISPGGFNEQQIDALVAALNRAGGPVLAYCRSGTRSALLWALTQTRLGRDPDRIGEDLARAGYDIAPIRPLLDRLATSR